VPPAVPGAPGDDPTRDIISGANAHKIGLTFYHAKPGPGGALGLAPGSTEAMRFTNVDSRYVAAAALTAATDTQNFGLEAYVQISPGVTNARWFYNGGDGTPLDPVSDGYGLGISGGFYAAIVAGAITKTKIPANPAQPVEMALVNTGGTNFNVYVQDVLVKNFAAAVVVPAVGDFLSIGNFVGNQSPPAYAGVVDEARVFTFAPGGFDPKTDLGGAAVIPEPASLSLLVCGAAGLLGRAWRRRRAA
jgi:hypothetical protein